MPATSALALLLLAPLTSAQTYIGSTAEFPMTEENRITCTDGTGLMMGGCPGWADFDGSFAAVCNAGSCETIGTSPNDLENAAGAACG